MVKDTAKNAIILAAGKSNRFAPFTYEKPKGLFCIRGEILVERQIEQLIDSGIQDIYIVVGYMKEKYFYLEQKYNNVHLIVNNDFGNKGNIYSLYTAKEYLNNSFVCCVDHYYVNNPFLKKNKNNDSYRLVAYQTGKFREFGVKINDSGLISNFTIGGKNSEAMVGLAYFNTEFSNKLIELMEEEIDDYGISSMFWEEFYAKHMNELPLYGERIASNKVFEFESIDDLRGFDSDFLLNVDSDIVSNIVSTLKCYPNDIKEIDVISAGLTNVSFAFTCREKKYVYRHPGGTAGNLVDRKSEVFAQLKAKEIGIDESVIHIDLLGWKLSDYVEESKNCNFEESDEQLTIAMDYLHRLHKVEANEDVRVFDNVNEGKKLMRIASSTKGNLEKEFKEIIDKVDELYPYVKKDAERLGYDLVLCHNDTYEPNYLYDKNGKIYLIDWEYAGINYGANDIGCILCRYDWSDEQIERYLKAYIGRELNEDEHRYYMAFICISAFYWFCWGLYKGSVGDDDSFFFLPSYRNLVRFIDQALESYEGVSL